MNNIVNAARDNALTELEQFRTVATSLVSYQSNGRVLVIGDSDALSLCPDFVLPLDPVWVMLSASAGVMAPVPQVIVDNRQLQIGGHLGQFELQLTDAAGESEVLQADLVLDLSPVPLLALEVPPSGYLHRVIDAHNAASIAEELIALTGAFEKPKYFNYDASICAHGVNGATFCTQCIDACPAGAITSLVEKIQVDSFLCQGGGTCASVCPSGAIQYVYPRLSDAGNRIRKMLSAFREHGGEQAVVMFYTGDELPSQLMQQHAGVLPVRVEELASAGMDLSLSALVYGADQVIYLLAGDEPGLSVEKLQQQLQWLQGLLAGLDMETQRVMMLQPEGVLTLLRPQLQIEAALYTMPDAKRSAIFQAVDHLYQQTDKLQDEVILPAGAPFGNVEIDGSSCTLCMACVGACPGNALQDGSGREIPEIFFIESHCLQCGVCVQTCPEQAVQISARFVFDREQRNRSRVLNQDSPFACISCGKAFASGSVIRKMNEKLKDHYMFQTPRALDRLKMCEDCRVVDIVQDPDALNGNYEPLN